MNKNGQSTVIGIFPEKMAAEFISDFKQSEFEGVSISNIGNGDEGRKISIIVPVSKGVLRRSLSSGTLSNWGKMVTVV